MFGFCNPREEECDAQHSNEALQTDKPHCDRVYDCLYHETIHTPHHISQLLILRIGLQEYEEEIAKEGECADENHEDGA